jgi:protein SPT2
VIGWQDERKLCSVNKTLLAKSSQFLDSVLSSIDSKTPLHIPDITGVTTTKKTENIPLNTSNKRKAEDDLRESAKKAPRIDTSQTPKSALPSNRPIKTPQSLKPNGSTLASGSKLPTRPQVNTPASAPAKNPSKGSFAAIMARAKQNTAVPSGNITHKPKERLSMKKELALEKEKEKEKELAKKKTAKAQPEKSGSTAKSNEQLKKPGISNGKTIEKNSKSSQITNRPSFKPQTVNLPSTKSKPRPQSTYQSLSRTSSAPGRNKAYYSDSDKPRTKVPPRSYGNRRNDYSGESEEEGSEEDPYDYASDDYSDMDAGYDELEEEETMAEKIARKEDAAEQAELERLKREKDRKKLGNGKVKR